MNSPIATLTFMMRRGGLGKRTWKADLASGYHLGAKHVEPTVINKSHKIVDVCHRVYTINKQTLFTVAIAVATCVK